MQPSPRVTSEMRKQKTEYVAGVTWPVLTGTPTHFVDGKANAYAEALAMTFPVSWYLKLASLDGLGICVWGMTSIKSDDADFCHAWAADSNT